MHHRDSHQENRRNSLSRTAKPVIESLEKRQMLAGNVFDIKKLPVFTPTSGDLNDTKNGPLGNVSSFAAALYIEYRNFVNKGGRPGNFNSAYDSTLQIADNQVAVDIHFRGTLAEGTKLVRKLGGSLIYRSKAYSTIEAFIPIAELNTLARTPAVASVNAILDATSHSVGAANNQAEEGQNIDSMQSTFNLNGAGVKIGVVSDSVNSVRLGLADSTASGDLPPPSDIDVIDDTRGGDDEGRAMLELIHDLAPKASLAFSTIGSSQLTFANNIYRLYEAGCDVIVDDFGFNGEPIFQEGVINQAITNVTSKGVVYASAAGNANSAGYQTVTNWVIGTDGRRFMDWDPDPNHVDTRMSVDFSQSGSLIFQWDNPYNGLVGAPTTDLDFQVIEPTTGIVVAQGVDANFFTGVPQELVGVPAGNYELEVWVNDTMDAAELPRRIGFLSQQLTDSFRDVEYKPKSYSTILGHAGGLDTLSVAAVPFWESPAYDDNFIESEDFTSFGPTTLLFKMDGTRRAHPLVVAKPDLSGVDNVNTSFFGEDVGNDPDKSPNFAGTSAAATNVAATAALLIQLARNQSVAYDASTIKNALIMSAKMHPTNGAKPGEWDRRGGYGLVDGVDAARILLPDTPSPEIQRVVPFDSPRGVDQLTIEFNEPITGFDISDLSLTRKGVSVFNGNQTLVTDDNQTFYLKGLKKITNRRGTYKLTLDGSGITDSDNNTSLSTAELFYVSGKPTNVIVTAIAPDELNVTWYDNAVGEEGYRVYRSSNSNFSDAEVFDLPAGAQKLRDTGLVPATQYFYKVLPIYEDIEIVSSPSAAQNGFTLAPNEIVLDNLSSKGVEIVGDWRSTSQGNKWGLNFLDDKGEGKGDKSVTFTPNIKESGDYLVYIRWVEDDNRATKVPVTVKGGNGVKHTRTVNQREKSGWKLIGKFAFAQGRKNFVTISNEGTRGIVVADAARFVKSENGGPDPIDSGTGF